MSVFLDSLVTSFTSFYDRMPFKDMHKDLSLAFDILAYEFLILVKVQFAVTTVSQLFYCLHGKI